MSEADSKPVPKKRGRPKKAAAFDDHVESIARAKELGMQVVNGAIPADKTPQAALDIAWEIVFDFFWRAKNETIEISELNTLAGVVQKLVSSGGHLAASESKMPKHSPGEGLSDEALREIEKKLKLL